MFEKLIKIILALIEAINANTAALQAQGTAAVTEEEGQAADADAATEDLPVDEPIEDEPAAEEEPVDEPIEEEAPAPAPKAKGKPAPAAAAKPAPAAKGSATVTLTDLRAVASELLGQGKTTELKAVLAKFKADSLTKLDERHYPAALAALKKA